MEVWFMRIGIEFYFFAVEEGLNVAVVFSAEIIKVEPNLAAIGLDSSL